MPRGHKVLSYAEVQARCRAIFRGLPDIEPEVIEAAFKVAYGGFTLTRSELAAARREVLDLPYAPAHDKDRYLVAWLSLRPDLPLATLDQYTLVFFGSATRTETFERCRLEASRKPLPAEEARALIAKLEQRAAPKPTGFALDNKEIA